MTEQEIFQVCLKLKTLRPLIQAVRFGAIKFRPLPRTAQFYFGMESTGGLIRFEHDIYFYTFINGNSLDKMIFVNDPKDSKTSLQQELSAINDNLRGI